MGFTYKNQKVNPKTGIMEKARLYYKCGACKWVKALHCFPQFNKHDNKLNASKSTLCGELYLILNYSFTDISEVTVLNQRQSLFALLC